MTRQKEQIFLRRFFASRLFLVTALVMSLTLAFFYARAYYQDFRLKQEINRLQEEVQLLEKKKLESLDILQYVMSDEFVEDKARTELHMKKPGEKVIVVQGERRAAETSAGKEEEAGQTIGNPLKWWYYFLRKNVPQNH